jgi:hypothetical protein
VNNIDQRNIISQEQHITFLCHQLSVRGHDFSCRINLQESNMRKSRWNAVARHWKVPEENKNVYIIWYYIYIWINEKRIWACLGINLKRGMTNRFFRIIWRAFDSWHCSLLSSKKEIKKTRLDLKIMVAITINNHSF